MEDTSDDLVIIKSDDEKGEEADEEVGLVGENDKIYRKIIIRFYYSLCFCSFSVLLSDLRLLTRFGNLHHCLEKLAVDVISSG